MTRTLQKFLFLGFMLLGLPLLGVLAAGKDAAIYLEFPPSTQHVEHAPFSWTAFTVYSILIMVFTLPFIVRLVQVKMKVIPALEKGQFSSRLRLPWWGWLAVACGIVSWTLAWSRFSWFQPLQPFTFLPLWLSFIVVVNALTQRRKGSCLLTEQPLKLLILFPFSALFWWFFEYLNRFVQNWHYVNVQDFTPLEYGLHATLAFSTVLPSVLSVREWFLTFPAIQKAFAPFVSIPLWKPKIHAWLLLIGSGLGLFFMGIYPNHLFALLWVAPLTLLISTQILFGEKPLFGSIFHGDWRLFVASALAALFCGWFWEMWNMHSEARWVYTIPHVERFRIFEMPLLGYAGYLPFGLQCAAAGDLVSSHFRQNNTNLFDPAPKPFP